MASNMTTPMLILVGGGILLYGWQQGWFSGLGAGGAGGEVFGQSEFEATGISTLCKCGSARATHVGGDCSSCKASCQERCGNCTPQCITSGAKTAGGTVSKNPVSKITSTLCKCGSGRATHVQGNCSACRTTCRARCGNCSPQCIGTTNPTSGPNVRPAIQNVRALPRKALQSTLCKCGSGRATHVIGDCMRCRQTCRSRCGACSPQCLGTRSNLAGQEDYFPQELVPSLVGREEGYEEPLYFSNVGYVGNIKKTSEVTLSPVSISQVSGPW